jgi:hypothetical protein
VVIFGWLRQPTFLASRLEECSTCRVIGNHWLVRKTTWFTLFWIPVLLLWVSHGQMCGTCGMWTGMPYRQIRAAMKTGTLHIEKNRPTFAAQRADMADGWGRLPSEQSQFNPLHVNPNRGPLDFYLKAWIVVAVAIVALFVLNAALR